MNKFKSYYFSFIGVSLVGISIGYVVGFYTKVFFINKAFNLYTNSSIGSDYRF